MTSNGRLFMDANYQPQILYEAVVWFTSIVNRDHKTDLKAKVMACFSVENNARQLSPLNGLQQTK